MRAPATFPDEPEPDPEVVFIERITLVSITPLGAPAFNFVEVCR